MLKIIILLLFVVIFSEQSIKKHYGEGVKTEVVREWELVDIDTNGIDVSYFDEMSVYHEIKCIGVWENKTQYKLTWKNSKTIILEKGNLTAMKIY